MTTHRGEVFDLIADGDVPDMPLSAQVMATIHPSAILRGKPGERETALGGLVADLRTADALTGR